MSYIEFQNITKEYNTGGNAIFALKDASFSVEKGELAIILGASGAGKTTALNILGGMDTATSGHVMVDGSDITTYGKKQLTQYRRTDIGFVFQFYNLVPNLTALENVELASQICNDSLNAEQTLVKVGLEQRIKNFPAQLSGGTTTCIHCPCTGKKSETAALRRAYRCTGLQYRKTDPSTFTGYLPQGENHGTDHHPQLCSGTDGRPADPV